MADWDEIKKLAADFQRTQTSDNSAKISERNCIDIVKKLVDLRLIDVIYSCDGKEIITSDHLLSEIEDEVYVNGGRVHLSELASILNVDHQHVLNKANELTSQRPDEYNLILGQLIHSRYKNTLTEQINSWIIDHEQLSTADFAKKLDLPTEFLLSMVKDILTEVAGDFVISSDGRTFYTTDLMQRYKSVVAGTLTAITKPTNLTSIFKRLDIPDNMFISLAEELIREGRIDAILEDKTFIPNVYLRAQNDHVDKFFSSNSYIEYDMLSRIDIKQPQTFLKRRFPKGISLVTCFVGPELIVQVEGLVEDAMSSKSWMDLSTVMPPAIQPEDIEQIIQNLLKTNKNLHSSCMVFEQTVVCSRDFIEMCKTKLTGLMDTKAKNQLKEGKLVSHFIGTSMKKEKENRDTKESAKDSDTVETSQETERPDKSAEEPVDRHPTEEPQTKGKKQKKVRVVDISDESDDDAKVSRKSKDKKSGGGHTGREVKQKNVKKKYIPGNKNLSRANDQSDDEAQSKAPKSLKGRAARRVISPERAPQILKSKNVPAREPLIFMNTSEIVDRLKKEVRTDDEFPDMFLEFIADKIERDLNSSYELLARRTLDEYLASNADDEDDDENQNLGVVE